MTSPHSPPVAEIPDDIMETAIDVFGKINEGRVDEDGIAFAILAERETNTALRAEMDKLWRMFVAQCESIEDRENRTADPGSHEAGFYRGEKDAAKAIRRSIDHPKYNKADFPAFNGESI